MLSELAQSIRRLAPEEGANDTALPGVHCIKISRTKELMKLHWHAAVSLIAQGAREVAVGSEVYRYSEGHYIATPIDLPVTSRGLSASVETPYLCLMIDLDPLTLTEMAARIDQDLPNAREGLPRAAFLGKAGDAMLDAALRLVKLSGVPEDAPVLGPLVVKELIYHLLKGPDGPALRQFVRSGSTMHQVALAIHSLRTGLPEDIDVAALAKTASMSRSAFFKHFKEATAMSPIQYQKRLRLLEARRLMAEEGESAEGSARKVGYRSATQFSQEYSRMFSDSPIRDAMGIRKTGRPIRQM